MIPDISKAPLFPLPYVAPGPPAPVSKILNVSVEKQKRTNWCWASVGLGVRVAYNSAGSLRQCDIAHDVLGTKCCPHGKGCNEVRRLPPALGAHYTAMHHQAGHQTIAFVKGEIDAGNPLCVRIHRRHNGSGHFVIIAGYCVTSASTILWVCDPEFGTTQPWMFNEFNLHYLQNGFWHLSFETGFGEVQQQIGGPQCR